MNNWNSEAGGRTALFDSFAEVVKAIANGRRLELLEIIAQGEFSVEVLARATGMGMTTASSHLQTLKRAGLVQTRRQGTSIRYRMAGDDVAEMFVAAKRVALRRSPQLRLAVDEYLDHPTAQGPVVEPAEVTAAMVVLDVRPRDAYDAGHYPAAISMPSDELPQRYTELPADAEVVVYCRGELCRTAREAAAWLRGRGVDATAMDEGVMEWRASEAVELDVG